MSARPRQIIPSRLLVVEGDTELAFCLFVKRALGRGQGVQVVIENAYGGSPEAILAHARRLTQRAAYDHVTILLDADIAMDERTRRLVNELQAQVITPSPCFEGMLLTMMGRAVPGHTKGCKAAFHNHGLSKTEKLEADLYHRLFPPAQFNALAGRCPIFSSILGAFRNPPAA